MVACFKINTLQVNYQYWREGEVLALWQWLTATGAKLASIGMLGPLPGRNYAVRLKSIPADCISTLKKHLHSFVKLKEGFLAARFCLQILPH